MLHLYENTYKLLTQWPAHCVQNERGAEIYQPLNDELLISKGELFIYNKADSPDREEFSVFKNKYAAEKIDNVIKKYGIDRIDLPTSFDNFWLKVSFIGY